MKIENNNKVKKNNNVTGANTRTERVDIDPAQAGKWLKLNVSNRPMSLPKVKRLSAKMAAGEWLFTHQGIGFSNTDRLIDGQHRLAAIIDLGRSVPFLVTWGLDEEAFYHVDTGGTRTAADLLHGRCPDIKNRALMCAMANACIKGLGQPDVDKLTVVDFVEWYEKYLTPIANEIRKHRGVLGSASVGAAFMNCIRGPDEWGGGHGGRDVDTVMLALMRYAAMEWRGESDPLTRLFKKFLDSATSGASRRATVGKSLDAGDVYALTVSALRAELQGKDIGHLHASTVDWGDDGDSGQKPRNPKRIGGK